MEIIQVIFNPAVMVFMIPITAIVGGVYLSSLKIKARMIESRLDKEERKVIEQVSQENQELRQRLANLESIVTSIDQDALGLNANISKSLPRTSPDEGKNSVQ